MNVWFWIFIAHLGLNFILLISMIFLERKSLSSVISWITVLTVMPIVGFILYIVSGSGLSIRIKQMLAKYQLYEFEYDKAINEYLATKEEEKSLSDDMGLIKCGYNYGSVLCPKTDIKIYTSGHEKIKALIQDLKNAKKSINIEYYIFADDETGKSVMNVLIEKAKAGLEVNLIYDSIGCLGAPRRFFRKLKKAGGHVAEFFPPFGNIRLINLKMNYRNHKKIVVIDGKVAYTGGINIRNDHMGMKKRVSPWRDTHLRIEGPGVYPLQTAFLNDWRYVKKEKLSSFEYIKKDFYPTPEKFGSAYMQVITSGPNSPIQYIKETFIKMITNANNEILIQTPYFIPDESFMTALRIAIASGVKVKIMVPSKPDKKTIYMVTLSYLKDIAELGAEIYLYDGFLHSKTIVVDNNKLSVGTCNLDNRSFGLNFEDTVLIYDEKLTEEYKRYFENDLKSSVQVGLEYFYKKRWLTKFLQTIFRLFSPIL